MAPILRRGIAIVAAVLTIGGCGSTAAPRETARRLDALFADLHARELFDGAVVVGQGETIIWQKGFGFANAEEGVRFTPTTPVDGASLAKTFTAALLLTLASEKVVDLDAPARRLLPELPYDQITLRHLISHSNGLPDYGYFDAFLAKDVVRTTEGLLNVVAREKPALAFEPGTAFEYSSFGYDLAALAAARGAGEPYGTLLEKRIFRPLGIDSAFLRPGSFSEFPGVRTRGYKRVDGRLEPNEVFDLEAFHGGSNIYISVRDLQRWNASFFARSPLSRAVLEDAHQLARIGESRSALTLGSWYRAPDGSAYWYSGHLQGFHSEVFRDLKEEWSIAYASNNTIAPWLQTGIVRAVRGILAGQDPMPLQPPAVVDVLEEERSALAGLFLAHDGEVLEVKYSGGRLSLLRGGVSYAMVQVDRRFFYVPGVDYMIGFSGAGDARRRMHVSSNLTERWALRRSP